MRLLLEISFIEGVGEIIGLIVFIYVMRLLIGYYMGGLSRLSGRNIRVNGKLSATPDTIDGLNQKVKNDYQKAAKIISDITKYTGKQFDALKRSKVEHIIVDSSRDRIAKLKELANLKENGTINDQEFDIIKKEIFKDE